MFFELFLTAVNRLKPHLFFSALLVFIAAFDVRAQSTPSDQYKQIGGVAGLAEVCYSSKEIPQKLNALFRSASAENSGSSLILKSLVASYNDGYAKALTDRVVWISNKGDFSKRAFSCQETSDVNSIRNFEQTFLSSFPNGFIGGFVGDKEGDVTGPALTTAVGDRITTSKFGIRITSVETPHLVGNEFMKESPAEGGKYVAVQWEYQNISGKPIGIFEQPSLYLVDSSGTSYEADIGASSLYGMELNLTEKVLSNLNPEIKVRSAEVFEIASSHLNRPGWTMLMRRSEYRCSISRSGPRGWQARFRKLRSHSSQDTLIKGNL